MLLAIPLAPCIAKGGQLAGISPAGGPCLKNDFCRRCTCLDELTEPQHVRQWRHLSVIRTASLHVDRFNGVCYQYSLPDARCTTVGDEHGGWIAQLPRCCSVRPFRSTSTRRCLRGPTVSASIAIYREIAAGTELWQHWHSCHSFVSAYPSAIPSSCSMQGCLVLRWASCCMCRLCRHRKSIMFLSKHVSHGSINTPSSGTLALPLIGYPYIGLSDSALAHGVVSFTRKQAFLV